MNNQQSNEAWHLARDLTRKVKGRKVTLNPEPLNGHRSRGFTLIELLVVLVLIGIFSSLVFVAVAGGILRSEERRFVQSFTQTLVRARSAGLGRGEAVRFLIDGESRTFCVEGLKWQDIPESIKVEGKGVGEVEPGIHAVTFYPDGSSSGGEIDLKWEGGRMDRIVIDRFLGLVGMERISS
ncbi:MAG: hypothetical protein DRP28_01000 [Thermodesulfobacteriota bacterium]|nr:MAG: hypothetical protein DRP28_01000 [Thermodesulfobacteriota bacterium]